MKNHIYCLFLFLSLITHQSYAEYKDPTTMCAEALGLKESIENFNAAKEAFLRKPSHENVDRLTKTFNDIADKSEDFPNKELHKAVIDGDLHKIPHLVLSEGVDVEGKRGARPLSLAAAKGDIHAINLLLALGADINAPDAIGNSPLMYAVEVGQIQTVEHLLNRDADINMANLYGDTPLMYAVAHGHQNIFRMLAARGASLTLTGVTVKTILHKALIHSETTDRLSMVKTILDTVGNNWPEPGIINWPEPIYGGAPLHWAAVKGYSDVIDFLIERGARLDVKNKEGEYPIHVAARANQKDAFAVLMYANHILLYHDDDKGQNVMETARAHNSQEILSVLNEAPFRIIERPRSE